VARNASLPEAEWAARFLGAIRQLRELGYALPDRHLKDMSPALRQLGFADAAAEVLAAVPAG
jgi:hypothetical protein